MPQTNHDEFDRALDTLPRVAAVITAAFEGDRAGLLVDRLVQCSDDPPCVCVAAIKGHPIAPLIRDSHHFGLCVVQRRSKLLERHFALDAHGELDPFDSLRIRTATCGVPLLTDCLVAYECEVVRHFDLETDHELYIGQVLRAWTDGSVSAPEPSEVEHEPPADVGAGEPIPAGDDDDLDD